MHEWALLIMTVCVPAAVGGFLFLGLFHNKVAKAGQDSYKAMKLPIVSLSSIIHCWIICFLLPSRNTNTCFLYDFRLRPFVDE